MRYFGKSVLVLCTGVCLTASVVGRAAEPDKYVPDDAAVVAAVNVQQIFDSKLAKQYTLAEQIQAVLPILPGAQDAIDSLGVDPIKDIYKVIIAMPAGPNRKAGSKRFMILHGKFDKDKFHRGLPAAAKGLACKLKSYSELGGKLYEITRDAEGKPSPWFLALFDEGFLAVGNDMDLMKEACAKFAGKRAPALREEMKSLIQKMDEKQSVWLVYAKPKGADKAKKSKSLIEKIASATAESNCTDKIVFSAVLAPKTKVGDLADDVKKEVNRAKKSNSFLDKMLASFQIESHDANVTVSGTITSKSISKVLSQISPEGDEAD